MHGCREPRFAVVAAAAVNLQPLTSRVAAKFALHCPDGGRDKDWPPVSNKAMNPTAPSLASLGRHAAGYGRTVGRTNNDAATRSRYYRQLSRHLR